MPRLNGVAAHGDIDELECARRGGDGKVRVAHHAHKRDHPGMDVALQTQNSLVFQPKLVDDSCHGLTDVEAVASCGHAMDIVKARIAVENSKGLPELNANHARAIHASA